MINWAKQNRSQWDQLVREMEMEKSRVRVNDKLKSAEEVSSINSRNKEWDGWRSVVLNKTTDIH